MTDGKTGAGFKIALWLASVVLAGLYALFGMMKMTQSAAELSKMMLWVPEFPLWFVRGLGLAEVLGAIGLILPSLTRIQPRLTVLAALCILLHQACAVALHVSRGEFAVLPLNAVLIALAAFVFWGRRSKAVIASR